MNAPRESADGNALALEIVRLLSESQKLAYAILSQDLMVAEASPHLAALLSISSGEIVGRPLVNLLGEFVGAESALAAILTGDRAHYVLENITRQSAASSPIYLRAQISAIVEDSEISGLLLLIENTTDTGRLQQRLTQERNELRHEMRRRRRAESALQVAHDELEKRVQDRTAELARANISLKEEIKERQQAQAALQRSEIDLRAILDNSAQVFALVDRDYTVRTTNEMARSMGRLWLDQDLQPGDSILGFTFAGYTDLFRQHLDMALNGESVTAEINYIGDDGRDNWFEYRFNPVLDDGEVVQVCLSVSDINKRKEADTRLRLLHSVVVNTSDTVIITRANSDEPSRHAIVYVNKAFTRTTGYSEEEIIGQTRRVFHGPNTDHRQLEKIRDSLFKRESVRVEMVNYRKDGSEFWVDMTISPIVDENDRLTHLVSIERDITERKELESQLLQSQKMEAIGLLAGGIAHDFNNYLTVIVSYSDLLLHLFKGNEAALKYVAPIRKAGEQAAELTTQLLAFGRKRVFRPQIINLNDVVEDITEIVGRLLGDDIVIDTRLDDNLNAVRADPSQINQILMNLAVNARDAMPLGGTLTIETENVFLKEDDARLSPALEPGDYIRLSVSDTGSGIEESIQSRIFEPFFTTKEEGEGTGLGLATVYGIISQVKGWIGVESETGRGTRFEILIPQSQLPLSNLFSQDVFAEANGSETILLVEDDADVRELAAVCLRESGYNVLEAASSEQALGLCGEHEVIDLLLADVVMPGISGPELAEKVRSFFPKARVLFMSGYAEHFAEQYGVVSNQPMLNKPFTPDTLNRRIREALLVDFSA